MGDGETGFVAITTINSDSTFTEDIEIDTGELLVVKPGRSRSSVHRDLYSYQASDHSHPDRASLPGLEFVKHLLACKIEIVSKDGQCP